MRLTAIILLSISLIVMITRGYFLSSKKEGKVFYTIFLISSTGTITLPFFIVECWKYLSIINSNSKYNLVMCFPIIAEYILFSIFMISLSVCEKGKFFNQETPIKKDPIFKLIIKLIFGLIFGLLFGLIFSLLFGLIFGSMIPSGGSINGSIFILIIGLILGLIIGSVIDFS